MHGDFDARLESARLVETERASIARADGDLHRLVAAPSELVGDGVQHEGAVATARRGRVGRNREDLGRGEVGRRRRIPERLDHPPPRPWNVRCGEHPRDDAVAQHELPIQPAHIVGSRGERHHSAVVRFSGRRVRNPREPVRGAGDALTDARGVELREARRVGHDGPPQLHLRRGVGAGHDWASVPPCRPAERRRASNSS